MNYLLFEIWGRIFNILLALVVFGYVFFIMRIFGKKLSKGNPEYPNLVVCAWSLTLIGGLLVFGVFSPERYDPLIAYPISYYLIVFTGLWLAVIYISRFVLAKYYSLKKIDLQTYFQPTIQKDGVGNKLKIFGKEIKVEWFEIRRKMVHAIAPLILLTFLASPFVFYYANLWVYQPTSTLYSTEILYNINKLGDIESSEGNYAAFHTIYLVLFGAVFVQLQSEFFIARFPNQPFILHKTILKHKRLNEQGALGHHVYMIVGFLGAFTILTYLQPPNNFSLIINCTYAIILSATFGDLSAALIGMQFGERHWGINKHKSYIGTAAGMGITYIATFWFLGSFFAGLCVLVFIFTDLVLSKFKLCDNFWYPVLVAFILRLFWAKIDPLIWLY